MSKTKSWMRALMVGASAALVLAGCGGGTSGGDTTSAPATEAAAPSAPATGGTDFDALEIGECLQFVEVPGATPDASGNIEVSHEVVDCNLAGEFKYQVALGFDGAAECPTDAYTTYFQRGLLGGQSRSFCMAPVFEVGQAYGQDPLNDFVAVAADSPDRVFSIESVIDGSDPALCPDQNWTHFVVPDPAPAKVYCMTD